MIRKRDIIAQLAESFIGGSGSYSRRRALCHNVRSVDREFISRRFSYSLSLNGHAQVVRVPARQTDSCVEKRTPEIGKVRLGQPPLVRLVGNFLSIVANRRNCFERL